MIQSLVDFALRQRLVILVATLIVALWGVESFTHVPIEAYPDVGDTQVQVISQWPGHASEEIERLITVPIEREMNTVPRQATVRSVSISGLSVVTVTFSDGTSDYFARQQALEKLGQVELPPDVSPRLGPLASPIAEILRLQVVNCAEKSPAECRDEDRAADPLPLSELKDIEEWTIEPALLRVDGVADVASFGGTTKQYQVLIDPHRLAARGLELSDVERALAAANGSAGGGVVAFGPAALNVRALGLLRPDQIGEVAISAREGTPVRVRDVATVEIGYQPRLGRVSLDGQSDVVAATVLLRRGDDAQTVLGRVHEAIGELNGRVLPRGVKVHVYQDRSKLMQLTTHTVLENLTVGILLVVLVLFVFLGSPRAALIVAVTIPISLLCSFIGMRGLGIPANLLSIGAVDFGMIVDGSIVMVENIYRQLAERRHRPGGADTLTLVRGAARQVARPIVFAIAIIIASYLPIFTLERVEGRLFRPMAWTVGFALLGALLLAVTLVPVLGSYLLGNAAEEGDNFVLRGVRRIYHPLLHRVLALRGALAIAVIVLLGAELTIFHFVGSEFLPHLNEGALWVRATMPGNISLEEAEHLVDGYDHEGTHVPGLRELLGGYPEVGTMAVQLGRPDGGTDPSGFYNAEFLLALQDRGSWRPEFDGNRELLEDDMAKRLAAVPGVSFGFSQPISDNVEEALTGVKGQLAVKILGEDLHALDDLASRVAHEIGQVNGVVDLGVFREVGQSNINADIRRISADRLGVTVADMEDVIEAGVGGLRVTQIVDGARRHDLVVRYQDRARASLDAIRELPIPIDRGHVVPLAEIADVSVRAGASRIFREDGERYVAIKFGVRGRDLGSTVAEAQARVERSLKTPPGYRLIWGGEFESAERAGARLRIVIPLTLLVIFVLLAAMFRRPREALLILGNVLLTAPLGGLVALSLTNTALSVSAGVGFLALFGVSVQTGVILISYINELRSEGAPLEQAVLDATDLRLRPMMMTALVATLGLLPAALSHGIGSDSQKPLAIVVVGGLLSSLVLSLFTLPLLYRAFAGRPPRVHGIQIEDAEDRGLLTQGSVQ
ncbi:MAG TPA: CusA/CzcA family heavy metal efflux RND transporter [Polyangiaceae bacterium]|nr:CusA/CzcA family heavy metal efflux RND transporter [Polyangiaceae bacterium]